MRFALSVLPLLAAPMLFAQAPVQTPRPFTLPHTYSLDDSPAAAMGRWSCPVGMTAERQATGATQWVVSLEDSGAQDRMPPGRMGVHVGLKSPLAFREAKVAVSYQASPAGALLVNGAASMETKTFDLSVGEDPAQEVERSLLLGSGLNVTGVKLISLTYADGTVWQPSANYGCSVRVSHLLRVAAAR